MAWDETEDVIDNPTGWVAKHIHDYLDTDGRRGHRWHGMDTLLLTTHGRKSGKLRRTALIYGRDGDRYLVVASNSGAKRHPAWYLNLVDNPEVLVQVAAEKFSGLASPATGMERARLWQLMVAIFPHYEVYQGKAERVIPVVTVERA